MSRDGFKKGGEIDTYTAWYQYANGLLVASVALLILWSIAFIAFALHFHYLLCSYPLCECVFVCLCFYLQRRSIKANTRKSVWSC